MSKNIGVCLRALRITNLALHCGRLSVAVSVGQCHNFVEKSNAVNNGTKVAKLC